MELGAVGPAHVQETLRPIIDPKDVLVLEHFNACLQDIPYKPAPPKGTSAMLQARERAGPALQYGQPLEETIDTFLAEAKEAYRVNL